MAADLRFRSIVALVIYLAIVLVIGFAAKATFTQLIFGFLPSIIFMIIIYSSYHILERKLLWLMPVVLGIFFIGFGFLNTPIISSMEFLLLALVNLIISYVILVYLHNAKEIKKAHAHHPHYYTPHVKEAPKAEPKPTTVQENMQSIVANCKALNHVIGRVYTKRNGGSDVLRQRIRIPPEVYHDIETNLKKKNIGRVKELLDYLQMKIDLFRHQEKAIFGSIKLKNLRRDEHGMNTIEQVLIHNDSDPVHTYLQSIRHSVKFIEKDIKK